MACRCVTGVALVCSLLACGSDSDATQEEACVSEGAGYEGAVAWATLARAMDEFSSSLASDVTEACRAIAADLDVAVPAPSTPPTPSEVESACAAAQAVIADQQADDLVLDAGKVECVADQDARAACLQQCGQGIRCPEVCDAAAALQAICTEPLVTATTANADLAAALEAHIPVLLVVTARIEAFVSVGQLLLDMSASLDPAALEGDGTCAELRAVLASFAEVTPRIDAALSAAARLLAEVSL